MALPGTSALGSESQRFSNSAVQVMPEDRRAEDYANPGCDPALRPSSPL